MNGLTHLPGLGYFIEYCSAIRPRITLAFLHLKTVDQNTSLEAALLDLSQLMRLWYHIGDQRRLRRTCAVSPEPSLFAHIKVWK